MSRTPHRARVATSRRAPQTHLLPARFSPSPGFTLVELLVVIAIIGILVGLLLPAVNNARESGRRITCANNIRGIGTAMQAYHEKYRRLPVGVNWTTTTNEATWAWPIHVLPFLDQENLYIVLRPGERNRTLSTVFAETSNVVIQDSLKRPLPIFRCPSDSSPDVVPGSSTTAPQIDRQFTGSSVPQGFEPPRSNYVACMGFFDVAVNADGDNGVDTRGMFINVDRGNLTFDQARDGPSNTFMLGERDGRCNAATWIGVPDSHSADQNGIYWALGRVSVKPNDVQYGASNTCTEGFSSAHPGGANFVLCDGSVKFISESIDYSNSNAVDSNGRPRGLVMYATDRDTDQRDLQYATLGVYQLLGIRDDRQPVGDY